MPTADERRVEGLHLLGIAAQRAGRAAEAAQLFARVLALAPRFAEAHSNLGNALASLGRLDEAVASYERALAIDPGRAEIAVNLGLALERLGRHDAAAQCYERALAVRPDLAQAHNSLGNIRKARGRRDEAAAHYERALLALPDYAEAHNNLGLVLRETGRLADAAAHFARAEALRPASAEVQLNLGMLLQDRGQLDAAMRRYERALALKPDLAEAHANLGLALQDEGRMAEALAQHAQALALKPDFGPARFGRVMALLPMIYRDATEIAASRGAFAAALRRLCDEAARPEARRGLATAVGACQPFYLAYQGENDRALQELYGGLVCGLMAERFPGAALAHPAPGEPIRVGIVSGFLRQHSDWKVPIQGWLEQLDRRRFDILVYHTGAAQDEATERAARLGRFVQGPQPVETWRDIILADRPHVLLYPEIGMDATAAQLAALRLAPVQCASWGHPETSGFPTVDYFLSSALMEPPDGDAHYSERLVRLPNLGIFYEPAAPAPAPLDRAALGLEPDEAAFWCGQALYKYLPQHDAAWPRIARAVGRCRFVFVAFARGTHANELFRQRLARAFAAFGLDWAAHCIVLPPLDPAHYAGAMGACDVFLDSIGWSGCNSTLESLVHDLPIVTLRGSLMRGRHGAAILERMGVEETIAETIDDYVAIAARLAHEPALRDALRRRIAAGKHRLYRDAAPIRALEDFLDGAAWQPAPLERALAHADRGIVLRAQGQSAAAIAEFRRALAERPDLAAAHVNLGNALHEDGDLAEAKRCYERALALIPSSAETHWNYGLARLLEGDYAAGWEHYAWRWRAGFPTPPREFAVPMWQGEALGGARILLHSEQGLGDDIQFVRYAPLVAARGGKVVLDVPSELKALFAGIDGVEQVATRGDILPDFACHCPSTGLPRACGTTLAAIPARVPYLAADPARQRRWAQRIGAERRLRVGLVWAGRPEHARDRARSLPLAALAPLGGCAGVAFFALQKGEAARDAVAPPSGLTLVDLAPGLDDFAETAAAVACLDLVISVDTAVAHLAGALAKPLWLLLPRVPDWRWLMAREDSPWYPTARLFRQGEGGWAPAIEQVAAALGRLAGERG